MQTRVPSVRTARRHAPTVQGPRPAGVVLGHERGAAPSAARDLGSDASGNRAPSGVQRGRRLPLRLGRQAQRSSQRVLRLPTATWLQAQARGRAYGTPRTNFSSNGPNDCPCLVIMRAIRPSPGWAGAAEVQHRDSVTGCLGAHPGPGGLCRQDASVVAPYWPCKSPTGRGARGNCFPGAAQALNRRSHASVDVTAHNRGSFNTTPSARKPA